MSIQFSICAIFMFLFCASEQTYFLNKNYIDTINKNAKTWKVKCYCNFTIIIILIIVMLVSFNIISLSVSINYGGTKIYFIFISQAVVSKKNVSELPLFLKIKKFAMSVDFLFQFYHQHK